MFWLLSFWRSAGAWTRRLSSHPNCQEFFRYLYESHSTILGAIMWRIFSVSVDGLAHSSSVRENLMKSFFCVPWSHPIISHRATYLFRRIFRCQHIMRTVTHAMCTFTPPHAWLLRTKREDISNSSSNSNSNTTDQIISQLILFLRHSSTRSVSSLLSIGLFKVS